MDNGNKWGLVFTQMDQEKQEFIRLIGLNFASEERAKSMFYKIKADYPSVKEDCIVDLVDEINDIIEDYPLSREQVEEIVAMLGHEIEETAIK
jgi:hypothetical protein